MAERGPTRVNANSLNELIDLIEQATDIASKVDAPTADHLHLAKVSAWERLSQQTAVTSRNEWRDRPRQG